MEVAGYLAEYCGAVGPNGGGFKQSYKLSKAVSIHEVKPPEARCVSSWDMNVEFHNLA